MVDDADKIEVEVCGGRDGGPMTRKGHSSGGGGVTASRRHGTRFPIYCPVQADRPQCDGGSYCCRV